MDLTTKNPQNIVFQTLDAVPSQLWYLLAIGSIGLSLVLQLAGKRTWSDFVGKWPPTFLAIGIYHKLVRPGHEDATGALEDSGQLGAAPPSARDRQPAS